MLKNEKIGRIHGIILLGDNMDFIENLDLGTILLIPYNIKDKVLEYLDSIDNLKDIKLMTFNELKKGLLFDYDTETIYEVMKEFNLSYEVADDYIKNLYYIEDKDYRDKKLIYLHDIYTYLVDNNKLIKDPLFKNLLKLKKKIVVYGFDYINKFNNYLLDLSREIIEVEVIEKNNLEHKHEALKFDTMDEEIIYVAEEISKLINNGISLSKIYIANYTEEYEFTLKRIFNSYGIPYFTRNTTTLYSTAMGKYLVDNLDGDLNKVLFIISKKFDIENNRYNEALYNKLIDALNVFCWSSDKSSIKDMIIHELKRRTIQSSHYNEEIVTTSLTDNVFCDDEYVFLIGFNLGVIPKLKRDEDYINDAIKPQFMDTSIDYNKNIKESTINAIKNIKNLTITLKDNSPFSSYEPSFLIDDNFIVKKSGVINYSNYCDLVNKGILAEKIDNLIKYNEKDNTLSELASNYDIDYRKYDNKYKVVDNSKVINKINDKLNFSYSNISSYYACPFKFYINSVLHISEFKDTIDQYIGSLFHYVLEKCIGTDENIDKMYDEYISNSDYELTNKDKFFVDILRDEVHFVVNTIREQEELGNYEILKEQLVEIPYDGVIKTKIKGFLDKVLINDNDVMIIDYKTGSTNVNRNYFVYGQYLQLPIYIYLIKHFKDNANVAGIYLQHILNTKDSFKMGKDMNDIRKSNLKLDGLTTTDISVLSKFDSSYEKSTLINGVSLKKDGTFKNDNRMLSNEEQDEIYKLVEEQINDCIKNVSDAKFEIHPIKVGKEIDGCKFCEYRDICFKKPNDFYYRDEIKNERKDDEDGSN